MNPWYNEIFMVCETTQCKFIYQKVCENKKMVGQTTTVNYKLLFGIASEKKLVFVRLSQ